jgi:hypothetical protein
MNIADELQKLQQLHKIGALSAEEFAKAKQAVLNASSGEPIQEAGTVGVSSSGLPGSQASQPGLGYAAEWGLAGLLSGLTICLAFPISLILVGGVAAAYFMGGGWTRSDLEVTSTITFLAETVIIVLPALGLLDGLIGLATGRLRKSHLAVAGTVTALVALFFSILLMVATRQITNAMWKEQERREQVQPNLRQ